MNVSVMKMKQTDGHNRRVTCFRPDETISVNRWRAFWKRIHRLFLPRPEGTAELGLASEPEWVPEWPPASEAESTAKRAVWLSVDSAEVKLLVAEVPESVQVDPLPEFDELLDEPELRMRQPKGQTFEKFQLNFSQNTQKMFCLTHQNQWFGKHAEMVVAPEGVWSELPCKWIVAPTFYTSETWNPLSMPLQVKWPSDAKKIIHSRC